MFPCLASELEPGGPVWQHMLGVFSCHTHLHGSETAEHTEDFGHERIELSTTRGFKVASHLLHSSEVEQAATVLSKGIPLRLASWWH